METATLNNNAKIPMIGLGTWKSAPGEVKEAVKQAIKAGFRHIDCAHAYANEAEIGEALKECFEENIVKREDLFITSKLWNDSHKAQDVMPALQNTLKNLCLDYLDMYLMHWPVAIVKGASFPFGAESLLSLEEVPVAETWGAMEECVSAGLTKGIGVSNFSVKKLKDLCQKAKIIPAINQVERHPIFQQKELLAYCKEQGIHMTAYSPLGSMDRPPQFKAADEPIILEEPLILEIAAKHKVTPAQVLLKWAVQSGTSVIPKTVKPHRMKENLQAIELVLDQSEMDLIAGIDRKRRILSGSFWCIEGSPYTMKNLWDE